MTRDELRQQLSGTSGGLEELRLLRHELEAAQARIADLDAKRNDWHQACLDAAREAACFRAARLTWPPHVLEAVARGDKSVCEEDAKRRHANWERMTSVARALVALAEQESFEAEDIGDLADRARAALAAVEAK